MINVGYRWLDECRLIHQHPQTYYHQNCESVEKPAPVSKLSSFFFFFPLKENTETREGCGDPLEQAGNHRHLRWPRGTVSCGPLAVPGGDADTTCRMENRPGKVGVEEAKSKLSKKKCIRTWNSAVGLESSEDGSVAKVSPRGRGSFLGACTRAVPPALGLLPLPNCDQMRVK